MGLEKLLVPREVEGRERGQIHRPRSKGGSPKSDTAAEIGGIPSGVCPLFSEPGQPSGPATIHSLRSPSSSHPFITVHHFLRPGLPEPN